MSRAGGLDSFVNTLEIIMGAKKLNLDFEQSITETGQPSEQLLEN